MAIYEQTAVTDSEISPPTPVFSPRSLWKLARPHQWVKNAAVLVVPLLTLGQSGTSFAHCLTALLAFCLISSSIYILNDCLDVSRDRLHPLKRHRPLPSGAVSKRVALTFLAVLAASASALGVVAGTGVLVTMALYAIINIAYCLKLKHIPIFDILCVSSGFVLRVVAGAVSVNMTASPSLLGAVAAASFALTVAKRRTELGGHSEATRQRPVLAGYDIKSLDQAFVAAGIAAAILYFIFITAEPITSTAHTYLGSGLLALSMMTALSGLLRLLNIIHDSKSTVAEDPARMIVRDATLRTIVLAAVALTVVNTLISNSVFLT